MAGYKFLWAPAGAAGRKLCVARPAAHKKGHAIALLPCEIDNFSEVQRRAAHPKFAGVCGQCRTQNFRPATKKKQWAKANATGGIQFSGNRIYGTSHPRPTAGWPLLCPLRCTETGRTPKSELGRTRRPRGGVHF